MRLDLAARRSLVTVVTAATTAALAGAVVGAAPPAQAGGQITVALRDGVLYVAGNDTANVVRLSRASDGRIVVSADSRIDRRGPVPRMRNVRSIRVSARGGDDTVRLHAGLPPATVLGGAGDDRLVGGSAAETLRGGAGDDVVLGGGGADLVMGEGGNDDLNGQAGNDRVVGGAGADTILGQAGDDVLRGDAGNDTYLFDQDLAQGKDVVRELAGRGTDTIDLKGTRDVVFSLASAAPQAVSPSLTITLEAVDAVENLHTGPGEDTLTGNALANQLNGGEGTAWITGGAGPDKIVTGNAADFGPYLLLDFTEEDTIQLYPDQYVRVGMGTTWVVIGGPFDRDQGAIDGGTHSFVADDFITR